MSDRWDAPDGRTYSEDPEPKRTPRFPPWEGRVSDEDVYFFAPGLPQTKGSAKAIPFRRGNRLAVAVKNDNPKAKAWAGIVALAAREAMQGRESFAGPVHVEVGFYLARPKAHRRANGNLKANSPVYVVTKPDGDKLERCLWDALTGIVFRDDAQVVSWHARKMYEDCGSNGVGAAVTVKAL